MSELTAVPTGPHTPVSNQPDEEADVSQPISSPSYAGSDGEGAEGTSDGTESVPGHAGLAELAAVDEWHVPDQEGLRDIAEASFGSPPPREETVHGPDNRVQIANPGVYPWRLNCSLFIVAADNSTWIGTGWFIGPHTVMTAGHVVHIKNSGVPGRDGWVKSIQVMPGRNGGTLPYGSVTSTNFRSVTGWTQSGDETTDYGAIILPSDLGNQTGWFGFHVYNDAELGAATVNIAGYPGDKPSGTLWYQSNKVASVGPKKVFYDIDTAGGQSGSAVYRIVGSDRLGVAVHAYGGATTNSGTRVTSPVASNMQAWKA